MPGHVKWYTNASEVAANDIFNTPKLEARTNSIAWRNGRSDEEGYPPINQGSFPRPIFVGEIAGQTTVFMSDSGADYCMIGIDDVPSQEQKKLKEWTRGEIYCAHKQVV